MEPENDAFGKEFPCPGLLFRFHVKFWGCNRFLKFLICFLFSRPAMRSDTHGLYLFRSGENVSMNTERQTKKRLSTSQTLDLFSKHFVVVSIFRSNLLKGEPKM